jgi:hypothetical protein
LRATPNTAAPKNLGRDHRHPFDVPYGPTRAEQRQKTWTATIVILRAFGPVEFLFDVADTEGKPIRAMASFSYCRGFDWLAVYRCPFELQLTELPPLICLSLLRSIEWEYFQQRASRLPGLPMASTAFRRFSGYLP